MKPTKFTFKRHKPEIGLRHVGHPHPTVDIKLAGKVVGYIAPPTWQTKDSLFRLRFAIVDANEHCGWRWIQLAYKADTEQDARQFITLNNGALQEKYVFHYFDE